MKKNNNIDELITKVLSKEEAEFYHQLDEQDLPEMISGLYQGKLKWLTILMTIIMTIVFAAGVYFAVRFFNSSTTAEMIKWAAGVFISLLMVSFLKLLNWIQIYSNRITRELKRLEFQISILTNKISKN